MEDKKLNLKKHLLIFIATLLIFSSGFLLSDFLVGKKIVSLTNLQDSLSVDILSLETQFSILNQAPCENLNESTLTEQLYKISQQLASIESNLGRDNPDFLRLKKFYSILQIKHWLLLKRAAKECKLDVLSIIYFYSEKSVCSKCSDQGHILTYLRNKYPFLRVYSFDYNLELTALDALKSIYSLEEDLPIIVINDDPYYGFKSKEELLEILGEYIDIQSLEELDSLDEEELE